MVAKKRKKTPVMRELLHQLPDYKVGRPIGHGARSVIYKMKHKAGKKILAGKFVRMKDAADKRVMKHLKNENKVLQKLHDNDSSPPQIIDRHDFMTFRKFFRLKGACLLVQYVPGSSLQDYAGYSLCEKLDLLTQICEALEYMHQQEYVHADLKPDNIIVTPQGNVKLIDFGFAAPIGSKQSGIKGTTGFLAPEQKGGILNPATDVYNLGAAMYWLMTGENLPYVGAGNSVAGAASSHTVDPTPPHHINTDLPTDLSKLILECCSLEMKERPPLPKLKGQIHDVALRIKMQT